jgi:SAM-dependent methyltransferase
MSKTWEETIRHIRTKPEFASLVHDAYLGANLKENIERFRSSTEFIATLKILNPWLKQGACIADIGSGNGISAVSFALNGYKVSSVEPDPSDTIGAGAQKRLAADYNLQHFEVYIRQAMHHAHDLHKFITEAARLLKKGGVLFTVRDHVVFDEKDKLHFLNEHPLHKFYGGENAFSPTEYAEAMKQAGLTIIKEYRYHDTPVNFAPLTPEQLNKKFQYVLQQRKNSLKSKIGILASIPLIFNLYNTLLVKKGLPVLDERLVPGRVYSYLAQKKT